MLKVLLLFIISLSVSSQMALAAEDEEVVEKTSAYVSLGDPMVLNLSNDSRRLTFLQLKADVLVADSAAEETIKIHIPAIRHKLIVLLSEQKANDMKTSDKREEVRKIATAQVQELVQELSGSEDVKDILFSSFLVQ